MADVVLIESPSRIRKSIVWIAKGKDEDWGTQTDDVYHDRRFEPNRACVIVTESNGRFWSSWMQVRYHYYGDPTKPDQEMCDGTHCFEGEIPDWMPAWAYDVRDQAVQAVKERDRG